MTDKLQVTTEQVDDIPLLFAQGKKIGMPDDYPTDLDIAAEAEMLHTEINENQRSSDERYQSFAFL